MKMYDTTIEHAREYGLECSNPLYIENLGVGDDVLKYIDEYAKANKHDLIFGHIQQNAEPSVNAIKIMIRKNGYSTIEGNNDFYKYVKVNSKFNDGGEVNFDDLLSDLDLDAIINDLEVKAEKKASKKKYAVKKDTDTGSKTFGKIVFGDEEPSYKKKVRYNDLQDIPLDETEKDTKEEAKIKNYLQNWVSNYSYHEELANEKELFKKLSREYPKVFKPATEKGTLLYRGLKRLNVEMLEELAQTTTLEDYVFFNFEGVYNKRFVLLKKPINYSPRKQIQSWTDNIDSARSFAYQGFLVTKQDDDYFINKELLEIMYEANENEVIHFGTNYDSNIYFAMELDEFKKLMPRLKGKEIDQVVSEEKLQFKEGGTMNKVKKGGITYGKSHAEGGIPVKNASTGDMLEVEGGEGIVNKRSMASGKKVKLNGKEMSLCEAVSELNQMEGGVQFNCDDVAHRQFLEEMALGGELERGTRTEKEHIQVLKDLYAKRITPNQATKRIAKDHLKEDKRYYSKLAKMEGKMTDGGKMGSEAIANEYETYVASNSPFIRGRQGKIVLKESDVEIISDWMNYEKLGKNIRFLIVKKLPHIGFIQMLIRENTAFHPEQNYELWSNFNMNVSELQDYVLSTKVQKDIKKSVFIFPFISGKIVLKDGSKQNIKSNTLEYDDLTQSYKEKMALGGMITDADGLKGHVVKFYEQGVKDPNFHIISKAYYSDPSFRFKTLSIDFLGGGTEVLSEGQIEAFLKGEQVQMKTQGKYDFYAIQLTPRKMKNGGQTADCGCGLTYAEGGFVEDKSPLEIGDVVYVIDNSKPRNEWLRGVYVEKSGNNAKVVITDADANQYEKTISFDKLIKLDIAQANPSDFKLFNQEFTKAKDNYFESLSKIGIIEERINRAKLFPDPDPAKQKKILADLKDELSKAEKFKSTASGKLSDVKDVPSAFYRYAKGGLVFSKDDVVKGIEAKNKHTFDLGGIKRTMKVNYFNIFLQDLSVYVADRYKHIARYSTKVEYLPNTKVQFNIQQLDDFVQVEFAIASRNIANHKSFGWHDYAKILYKLGFNVGENTLQFFITQEGRSRVFRLLFKKGYYNLFVSKSAINDLLAYLDVSVLMCITNNTDLETLRDVKIENMREVFENGEMEQNTEDSSGGSDSGSSGDYSDKIKEFLATYDESKNPSAFRPKKGESEVSGILNRIVENKLISKQEWDDCVQRAINTKELYDKLIQYHIGTQSGGKTSVLFNVLMNRVTELATANTEKALSLTYVYEKLITPKFTKEEMIDFPVLLMMIWEHKPPLDSSIFE